MGDYRNLTLNVEVCRKPGSTMEESVIEEQLENYLKQQEELVLNKVVSVPVLPMDVKYVRFCSNDEKYKVDLSSRTVKTVYHVYETWEDCPEMDSLSHENEELPYSTNWCLPNAAFEGLWESLILENDVKERLMSYVQTTLLYSGKQVNAQIVHWNGVLLLHGAPGTGKTTLCKALAQKLSIRMNSMYKTSHLIEINTHSLFSKWFSESAKLVLKVFTSIKRWLESPDHFVCILIDEVESLTHSRNQKGTEPSDSIRVVNTVLTQIDQLQRYPNFLILATSNMTDVIDVAFADRADLKLYIPNPSKWAIYEIFRTCLEELISRDLVRGNENDFFDADICYRVLETSCNESNIITEIAKNSKMLSRIADSSWGLSGRTVRKIPFLTSAKFINTGIPTVEEFLKAMNEVIRRHKEDGLLFNPENRSKPYYPEISYYNF